MTITREVSMPLDAALMMVFADTRKNAEDLVYVYLAAVEASNERVAALNAAAHTFSSMFDVYDEDGDGQLAGGETNEGDVDPNSEYGKFLAAGGWPDLEWYFGTVDEPKNDPPEWWGVNGCNPDQATAMATQLTNAATAEQSIGSVLLTKLQSANNDLDEADRISTAYIEKVFQTDLAIINNF